MPLMNVLLLLTHLSHFWPHDGYHTTASNFPRPASVPDMWQPSGCDAPASPVQSSADNHGRVHSRDHGGRRLSSAAKTNRNHGRWSSLGPPAGHRRMVWCIGIGDRFFLVQMAFVDPLFLGDYAARLLATAANNGPASASSGCAALLKIRSAHCAIRLFSGYATGSDAISVAASIFAALNPSRAERADGGRRVTGHTPYPMSTRLPAG